MHPEKRTMGEHPAANRRQLPEELAFLERKTEPVRKENGGERADWKEKGAEKVIGAIKDVAIKDRINKKRVSKNEDSSNQN